MKSNLHIYIQDQYFQGMICYFEDTSDATVLLHQQGMTNGSLLKLPTYPYWIPETRMDINRPTDYKFLLLPPDNFIDEDTNEELKEKTKVFNNRLTRLV